MKKKAQRLRSSPIRKTQILPKAKKGRRPPTLRTMIQQKLSTMRTKVRMRTQTVQTKTTKPTAREREALSLPRRGQSTPPQDARRRQMPP